MEAMALLCDHAHVSPGDNKLFINGANVNRLFTPALEAPMPIHVFLAIVITIPWQATNQRHRLTLELIYEDAEGGNSRVPLVGDLGPGQPAEELGLIVAEFNAGRSPDMANGEQTLMPIAIPFLGLPVPGQGAYFFDGKIDGSEVFRVPFRVDVPNFGMGGQFPRSA